MSWLELDDGILDHPKFIRAVKIGGSEAVHLWLGLRAYCGKHLTDGFVPEDMLDEVRGPKDPKKRKAALSALHDVNLLDPATGGVQMHDFLDWSASSEEVAERRRVAGMRSALRASPKLMQLVKQRDCGCCRYCGLEVDWTDRRGPLGGTYDHVQPLSKGGLNALENIVVACRGCNTKKGARLPSDAGLVLLEPFGTLPVNNPNRTGSLPVTTPLRSSPLTDHTHTSKLAEPTQEHLRLATDLGVDGSAEFARFKAHARGKGRDMANEAACFELWLRDEAKKPKRSEPRATARGGPPAPSDDEQRRARNLAIENAEAGRYGPGARDRVKQLRGPELTAFADHLAQKPPPPMRLAADVG